MRERFSHIRALCIGDVMLDCFVHGKVGRISPEGPVPVLLEERRDMVPGGVGNVARNIAALGAPTVLIAIIGNDLRGQQLLNAFEGLANIAPDFIVEDGRQTTTKTRYVVGNHQLLRVDQEHAGSVDDNVAQKIIRRFEEEVKNADVVFISDYAKGCLTDDILKTIIALSQKCGALVVADPKSSDFSRYRGVDVLKPNAQELKSATNLPTDSDDEVAKAGLVALKAAGVKALVVTRAEKGASVIDATGNVVHLRTRAREVFDVSGAGDTALALIGLGLGAKLPLIEAAHLANLAAGVVVAKAGTAVVHPDELEAAQHTEELQRSETKILPANKLSEQVQLWRRQNLKIAFTNGCFDLLHPGHLSLIAQARARGDKLIVGLNSDESVRRLKGKGRPVQAELARALVLAALSDVDAVVIFEEDTPLELIKFFKPDILVKGADYALSQVVGADAVKAYGGEIFLAELKEGFSTTSTIRALKGEKV